MNTNIRPTNSPAPSSLQQQQPPTIMQQQAPLRFPAYPPSHLQQQHAPFHPSQAHQPRHHIPPPLMSGNSTVQQRSDRAGSGCLPSPMPMTTQQQQEQTMLWGMQNYAMPHDSGFQSRATRSIVSNATSCYSSLSNVTGLDSECGDYYGAYPGAAGPSGTVFVPPGASTGCEMGPGTFDFGGGQQAGCLGPAQHAFLQQQGAALLYPDARETEQVMTALQELTKLLRDHGDLQSAKGAAFIVHNMAKTVENARLMIQSAELIEAVVATMVVGMENKDDELLKSSTGTLYVLSNTDEIQKDGLVAIYRSGAIPILIGLLSVEFEAVLYYSVTVLHNLLSYHPNAKEIIRSADAVPSFVRLLTRDHDKFLAIVTDSLRILCSRHAESMMKVCNGGAPAYLVHILEHSNYEKVLRTTARLIQTLSLCQYNKPAIVQAGGVHALARHLAHPSHRLVLNCLDALRSLSDVATYVEGVENLLDSLIQNLGSSDEKVVHHCVAILYNLTCKNAANKDYVCRKMGIESLTRTLNERGNCAPIAEDVLGVLRHLTWKWGGVRESRNKLRSIGCLPLIGRYLRVQELPAQFAQYPGVIIEALSLIRNLTMDGGASWPDFRHYNIVNSAATLTVIIRDVMNNAVNQPPLLNTYLEVMERALRALAGLCQDQANRQMLMAHPNIVALANDLLNHPVASIKEAAAAFLNELQSNYTGPANETLNLPINLEEDGAYMDETEAMHQQYEGQRDPFRQRVVNMEDENMSHQQLPQDAQYQQQPPAQPMAMPSPMPWSQQEIAGAGYENMNYDPSNEFFDYGIANSLLNDVDFGTFTEDGSGGGGAGHQGSDSGVGPSHGSSCSAVEPMKNMHL